MGAAAYLAYNKQLKSDVLDVFPKGSKALQAARGLMGLSTAVVAYPINVFVIRQSVRFLLTDAAGITLGTGTGTHLALTLGAFIASLAVSLSVDDLGTVFGVIGGTTGACLFVALPSAATMLYLAWLHVPSTCPRHGVARTVVQVSSRRRTLRRLQLLTDRGARRGLARAGVTRLSCSAVSSVRTPPA